VIPPGARLLVPVAALLVATGCVAGCAAAPHQHGSAAAPAPASTSAPAPAPAADAVQVLRIASTGGRVSGDTGTVEVAAGTPVRIEVTSDAAEEVHLHGYDKEAPVPAGGTATLAFTADIPGEFELEFHHSGDTLATLQVR
jgi:FtsP/CotA-like multicopper oxidase with cupredoxin domain